MFEQLLPLNSTLLLSLFPPSLLSLSFFLSFFLPPLFPPLYLLLLLFLFLSISLSFSFFVEFYLCSPHSLFLPFSSFHFFPSIIFCLLLITDNSVWTKSLDLHSYQIFTSSYNFSSSSSSSSSSSLLLLLFSSLFCFHLIPYNSDTKKSHICIL